MGGVPSHGRCDGPYASRRSRSPAIPPILRPTITGKAFMHLRQDSELDAFRQEIRRFIADVLPADIRERQRTKVLNNATVQDQQAWMRILDGHGRSVPHWPVEFGGCGWTPQQLFVFNEELYAADAPEFDWGGTHMLGPVLYSFGSAYLQDKFLPAIREGHY